VLIGSRDAARGAKAAADLQSLPDIKGSVSPIQIDVTDDGSVDAAIRRRVWTTRRLGEQRRCHELGAQPVRQPPPGAGRQPGRIRQRDGHLPALASEIRGAAPRAWAPSRTRPTPTPGTTTRGDSSIGPAKRR
jgi:hypothetical protein